MKYFATRLCGAVALLVFALSAVAANKPEVRIGWVYAMANAPAIIADKKGVFSAHGIDAKVTEFTSGPILFQALAGNQLDVGYVGFAPAAHWYARGLHTIAVAKVNYGQLALVVRKDSGINSLSDLKGKKIASVKKGSGTDALLRGYVLKEVAKLEPDKDVGIVPMPSGNMGSSMMTKVVDAAFMWEPFTTQYLLNGETKILFNVLDGIPKYPWYVIVVRKEFLEKNRDAVIRMLRAHQEAVDFLNSSPTAGNDIITATFKLPATPATGKAESNPESESFSLSDIKDASGSTVADKEVVRLARERLGFESQFSEKDVEFFERQIGWSRSLGFLKGELKAVEMVDRTIMKEAAAGTAIPAPATPTKPAK